LWDTSKWKPYFFFFLGGGSRNALDGANDLAQRAMRDNLIYALKKVPKISIKSLGTLSKFSISVSFIAVFGNRYSSFPKDYEGWFTGFSLSIKHIMVSAAYGQDGRALIGSFGLGVTTSCFNINLGQTYYWRISKNTTLLNILKPLRSGISNKAGWLRLFTFLVI